MKNYKIILQYDGTRYSGWQRQGNTDNTIEYKLSSVIGRMINSDLPVEIHGSGRTDSGVHAVGQVANFHIDTDMSLCDIMSYINNYLPEDIKMLDISEAEERFHARLWAKEKTYAYKIDMGEKADVFMRKYSWHIGEKPDVAAMKTVAQLLTGTHDYIAFSDMNNKRKTTVRTISSITFNENKDLLDIEFTGDGFLYHMVRKLTACLVSVGLGQMTDGDVIEILNSDSRERFKQLAPARGLFLKEVKY